jgi:hypothetical protein
MNQILERQMMKGINDWTWRFLGHTLRGTRGYDAERG